MFDEEAEHQGVNRIRLALNRNLLYTNLVNTEGEFRDEGF